MLSGDEMSCFDCSAVVAEIVSMATLGTVEVEGEPFVDAISLSFFLRFPWIPIPTDSDRDLASFSLRFVDNKNMLALRRSGTAFYLIEHIKV